ncbi:hypothetical protein CANTEDRAFT_129279 [Yamadazyma tenuis ATCC 10573]|uniref:Cell wall mannoprotein PIR1-like C-terminal domain-containing protein n=1 Tax=Candida tenuis (strain ATCC 10573 / BCRC 21748 / CBS 615 / JCM 9827 / NBRC 10315 / NRRL Y-1498 / VKM Y-70) TaxID=590646 RepID=G3AYD1_CANTC|nr:uncharacterized protein CANTEDRAFT_129279 [Yamadazyma tenuis ATCC 10573]EGV65823.1 hypothetical protein CANTEDRAFT_129279 [Yamadazyma tenuis ATCC 10573]
MQLINCLFLEIIEKTNWSQLLICPTISSADASGSVTGLAKRDDIVTQIDDGQIQQVTNEAVASVVNQISDGQIQLQTTATVLNQISDGQIQAQTTATVLNQISDGQIQAQTATVVNQISDGQIQQQTADVVNQIDDGQVQQQTSTIAAVNQISDGQIQQQTSTAAALNQISDGQVQAASTATVDAASQISDGQIQDATSTSEAPDTNVTETCVASGSLLLQLKDGILTDAKGRVGSIVANRQFQFDGPPPQAGAIYAAGWSVVPIDYKEDSKTKENADKGKRNELYKLALGAQTTFYKCLSGSFYNLYDQSIGGQCSEVEFVVLEAVEC